MLWSLYTLFLYHKIRHDGFFVVFYFKMLLILIKICCFYSVLPRMYADSVLCTFVVVWTHMYYRAIGRVYPYVYRMHTDTYTQCDEMVPCYIFWNTNINLLFRTLYELLLLLVVFLSLSVLLLSIVLFLNGCITQ